MPLITTLLNYPLMLLFVGGIALSIEDIMMKKWMQVSEGDIHIGSIILRRTARLCNRSYAVCP